MAATDGNQVLSLINVFAGCISYATCIPTMMFVRRDARLKRGIEGNMCYDCMAFTCCHCCAAIQLKHEFE